MKINMILKFYTRNWTQNKYATLLKLRIVELVYNLYWICYAKQERSLDVIKMSPLNPSQKLFSISCWILIYISTTHSSNWRYFMFLFILYLTVLKKAMRKSNTDIFLTSSFSWLINILSIFAFLCTAGAKHRIYYFNFKNKLKFN